MKTFEYDASKKTAKKHPQIVEISQFARNRPILQETDQNLPGAQ